MNKVAWLAVAVLLCLSACTKPAVLLDYPDDPRILHGSWLLEPQANLSCQADFQFDAAADNLIVDCSEDHSERYRQVGGDWTPVDGDRPAGTFDSSLDAFVDVDRQGSRVRVVATSLTGDVDEAEFTLTGTMDPEYFHTQGGLVATVTGTPGDGAVIDWWDTRTGAHQGSHALEPGSDGMRASTDGRALIFWYLDANAAAVFSFADPGTLVLLELAECARFGDGSVSFDGLWYVAPACDGKAEVFSLTAGGPASYHLNDGLQGAWQVYSSSDTEEIVWFDQESNALMVADIAGGTGELLHRIPETDGNYMDSNNKLYLSRSAGLLAYDTGRGFVRVVDLATDAVAELPQFRLSGVQLEIDSHIVDGSSTLRLDGIWREDGREYGLTGDWSGGDMFRYRSGSLAPASRPQQPARATLRVLDADESLSGDERLVWELDVEMHVSSTNYAGWLTAGPAGDGSFWEVRLVRP